ncbi:PEP/pyruvate-binding domain-containing protein [Desulforhabdus sp. TSK]|uniref:PEP/pyruvate-binding domain-containing protein n=1 Tax=Desulforhabdus sp. TSK TaxID=2925014 RepID=UPI001FC89047|nr:PEP/pyruvate-binding domain-containing protein [Desulforhabdus sp. TSK]GKT07676.1 phosphoenolpyruvate synthase [Desulforhabdus sp. TSK]
MVGLKNVFSFFRPSKPIVPFTVLFKKFRSILVKNNRILELMADMGDKLGGEYVFDRQYIVEACDRLNDLVFKMISDLCILNQQENVDLFIAFERIQHEIQEELEGRHAFPVTKQTILLEDLEADSNDLVGNKFATLGKIKNILDLQTPDGFVITTKAFFDFMEYNGLTKYIEATLPPREHLDDDFLEKLSHEVRERILKGKIPRTLAAHVTAATDILSVKYPKSRLRFAVRSSAWGEDGEYSFAGQYESVLNVPSKSILEAYKRVLASAYSMEAWHYRMQRGYHEHELAMAVGCQLMVDAEVSGAMYTYAPLSTENEQMLISAAWGLGPSVVQGMAESDTIFIDRTPPYRFQSMDVASKEMMLIPKADSGTEWTQVPEALRNAPSLNAEQMEKLAQAALVIEKYQKRPQDVEWAFDKDGKLFILQSRPLNIRPKEPEKMLQYVDSAGNDQVIFAGKGVVVQHGIAMGKAFVVQNEEDLQVFPHGSILVSRYTSPRYSRIMQRAQGIITDIGSATGHMSTLAREHRVPTIVDTGIATQVLSTGDEITLDATRNTVYRGIIKELGRFELAGEDVFEDSYEYRLLRRILKKINPLNLVDPHSQDFKPSRCITYHDITRYIHEVAVEKLINLSEKYQQYHNTTPKKLDLSIPLGLVVIDVDKGTNVAPQAKRMARENILSLPLKALIQGLIESGMWETQPVTVDLGSFMSSFTKPATSTLAHLHQQGRNLAVISKEYMNLSLKLGYHYNLLDAYIGDVVNNNYIYFRFLGGVTDLLRRSRRAKFIGDVLEKFDFLVEVHGDLVVAKIKKSSRERMIENMKMLGGLIGYTRQLDVRLTNEHQVSWCVEDFLRRIQATTEVSHERFS